MSEALLSDAELRALAHARLTFKRPRAALPGGHLTARVGVSLEFADIRPYQPGDDFRLIDWAIYARHHRLVTKVYSREVEAPLYLLVDASRSMGQGRPGKLRFSARLAGALAFVAFRGQDRFGVYPFRDRPLDGPAPRRGRAALVNAFRTLSNLPPEGITDLNASLVSWAEAHPEPGMCVVVSDFLCPTGYREGLLALRHGRHAVTAVQVLAPDDLDPPRLGEARLVDVETRRGRSLILAQGAWRAYREALHRWNERLSTTCLELGIAYFLFRSEASPVEAALTAVAGWGR
ncbi:DUF58 domain-containing protein [Candidatus Bipolaricaulota bacterium]|nr:DUF58 domain-containing protein [Candidatus Bipolaricaulota bacterium]